MQIIPQISIVLPVYNGIVYLEETISSILNQTISNYEVLICDDASTDESFLYLKQLTITDNRVKIFKNDQNLGLFKTLNKLIRISNGPLIHLWAQDDVMMPDCLEKCISFHQLYPDLTMSYHNVEYINEKGIIKPFEKIDGTPALIDTKLYAKISSKWGCIPGNISNVTINRNHAYAVGLFNEQLVLSADFDLWTKLAARGSIGRITEKLTYLRLHSGQLSRSFKSIALRIEEDIPIQKAIVSLLRSDENEFKKAKLFWRWKTQPTYFNDLLYLLFVKEFSESWKLVHLLKTETSIFGLLLRWMIVRALRAIKLDNKFYINVLDR
ncbi:glycosyltransferase [Pedobacter riviphilus]|uniref:Glycosyltransferase n=1 Tax=Pedobacter riviphilus TaxID=2766984 RepID=A0ABX6TIF0_9SPHI|nr:glycosyltransferase [Pedobacter riviphilus]QNR85294.1 glycosyltransferase [Pedobacter riviphilus]